MILEAPFLVQTDSYKAGHFMMYPEGNEMVAYMECRGSLNTVNDNRIVFYGIRYLYDTVLSRQITMKDIEEADTWYAHHGVAKTAFMWPRDLWVKVVEEHNGYIPITVQALPEGTVMYPHVPFLVIRARKPFERLVTWLEPRLTHIWSPIVTATKSRMIWDYLKRKFDTSVDDDMAFLLASRLHDFGYRGVSSQETAMTTGIAHLLSFEGTDTMSAGWLATHYNEGRPIGESVLATEHSVMTAWSSELEAVKHCIAQAPKGAILSVVADSYDYGHFLNSVLPIVAPLAKAKGILLVTRPDSGNPIVCVEDALLANARAFGVVTNKKGFQVLDGAAVIQGDGLDWNSLCRCADAVEFKRFSAQCVAYGMGGGLLQKQDRDTLQVATKLSFIEYADGTKHDVMKHPKDGFSKRSLPGLFHVADRGDGLIVSPEDEAPLVSNQLITIWDNGPVDGFVWDSFDSVRSRLNTQWSQRQKFCSVISEELEEKVRAILNPPVIYQRIG